MVKRFCDHKCSAYNTKKTNWCAHLNNAIRKYGKKSFIVEEIDWAYDLDDLNNKEEMWISFYNSNNRIIGYNIKAGGNNRKWSEETKEKYKIYKRNNPLKHSEEFKKRQSLAKLGIKRTKESIAKQQETRKRLVIENPEYTKNYSLYNGMKRK